jgi:hypothetical protein
MTERTYTESELLSRIALERAAVLGQAVYVILDDECPTPQEERIAERVLRFIPSTDRTALDQHDAEQQNKLMEEITNQRLEIIELKHKNAEIVAEFARVADELTQHSNAHIHSDYSITKHCAAVEGVIGDRLRALVQKWSGK